MSKIEIIEPSVILYQDKNSEDILISIERAGRTCYKSEDKITPSSAKEFVKAILKRGHESVIEHEKVTVRVICDRGVTHEIVRHRIGSYSQESTRYVNYMNKPMQFIKPCFWCKESINYGVWKQSITLSAMAYEALINDKGSSQEARSVLPNSLKTEIVITYNLREWRYFFKLRCSKAAHPQMRQVANLILKEMKAYLPEIFEDYKVEE
jgi:thymidylate synthase (FAD)